MENHSRKTFGGGSEALWGRALPQIGKMRFRSCVGGRLPFLPGQGQNLE